MSINSRRWYALAVVLAAVFLAAFDFNVVTIAIPSIQRGLGTSFGEIQLIVAGYALSFAVLLITGGRLGDRKSTRLNSSHEWISYAVFCLKKKNIKDIHNCLAERRKHGCRVALVRPAATAANLEDDTVDAYLICEFTDDWLRYLAERYDDR